MLRWLISAIGFAALRGEVSLALRRAGRRAMLTAIAILLCVAAFSFAVAAFAVWLSGQLGAIAACGIIGAGFAVIGLAIQVGIALTRKRPAAHASAPFDGLTSAGFRTPEVGSLGALAIIGIAGYLLGRLMFRK